MDGFANVLKKRGLIFKIFTWVCTGFILLSIFLPYAKKGNESVTLLDYMKSAIESIGEEGTLSYILKLLLIAFVTIGLAIAVVFYEKASLAISIVLMSCTVVAGITYLDLFSFLGKYAKRTLKRYKAVGGRMMDVFFIFLLIVSILALAAEIYVKVSDQQLGVVTKGGMGWFCPQCGQSNATDAKFCNRCGSAAPISKRWFCPQCGAPNEATGKFCNKCGTQKPE